MKVPDSSMNSLIERLNTHLELRHRILKPLATVGRSLTTGLTSIAVFSVLFAMPVSAESNEPLMISGAWVRAMPPGRKMTAAYMRIQNAASTAVVIEGVSADVADASLHETTTVNGQSRMRSISSLPIGPGESVVLEPGGRHIMLMGLEETPAPGDVINLCVVLDVGPQCIATPVQRSSTFVKH